MSVFSVESSDSQEQARVLIVGGGVAGLEAALALRALARDRVSTTLLAPAQEFVYRPMTVREPFAFSRANRYSLAEFASDIGGKLLPTALKWVPPAGGVVHPKAGRQLGYDALVLALGAKLYPRFKHTLTID